MSKPAHKKRNVNRHKNKRIPDSPKCQIKSDDGDRLDRWINMTLDDIIKEQGIPTKRYRH